MDVPSRLPDPSPPELALSAELRLRIVNEIKANDGFLPFDRYMSLALFEPGLGYYMNGSRKFGAEGDFVTAPEISPLFGRTLARQWRSVSAYGDTIIEFGGGTGRLAASVLEALAAEDALPARYLIVELSPQLREEQRARLGALAFADRLEIGWLHDAPAAPFEGLVIANEILDALPTSIFQCAGESFLERGVGCDDTDTLIWHERPADGALGAVLAERLDGLALPRGFVGEISLQQALWVADLPRFIRRGLALLLDYGNPRHDHYHPARGEGSVRCYWKHRLHHDPLWLPGLQDITASVDFTGVAEAAVNAGLQVAGFSTQAGFLLANGIEAHLQSAMQADPAAAARLAAQARMLLLPSEMGTSFRVMALGLGDELVLRDFAVRDERHHL